MIANINDIERELENYPSRYVYNGTTIDGYNLLESQTHYNHGWREVVTPEFNPVTQYLGSNELVEDVITKPVFNYTTEEIEALNIQKVVELKIWLYDKYESLLTSSLARAVGKENEGLTRDQLFSLREEYGDIKKLSEAYLADGTILNAKLFQDITDEMNLDFPIPFLDQTIAYLNSIYSSNPVYQIIPTDENTTQITKFCWLVVNKYNLGESVWQYLKDLCSKFRKRMITNLDLFEFEKFEQRKLLVNSINSSTTIEDIQDLETQFDAI